MSDTRKLPVLERALQIIDSGALTSLTGLRRRLVEEGYVFSDVVANLTGLGTQRVLRARLAAARGAATPADAQAPPRGKARVADHDRHASARRASAQPDTGTDNGATD